MPIKKQNNELCLVYNNMISENNIKKIKLSKKLECDTGEVWAYSRMLKSFNLDASGKLLGRSDRWAEK